MSIAVTDLLWFSGLMKGIWVQIYSSSDPFEDWSASDLHALFRYCGFSSNKTATLISESLWTTEGAHNNARHERKWYLQPTVKGAAGSPSEHCLPLTDYVLQVQTAHKTDKWNA